MHQGFGGGDITMAQEIKWGNPGALGLAGFGFNTILLQIHNIGIISNVEPLLYGFFWGGLAQLIAGIIDGRRGDTVGLTAFTSCGIFWMGLSFIFLMDWIGVAHYSAAGVEGIICGASAVYASAAVLLNATYDRWLLPIGLLSK